MNKILFLLLFSLSAFADTPSVDLKKYTHTINSSVTTFLVINYHSIVNEVNFSKGDYLSSLFIQAGIAKENEKTVTEKIKEIILSKDSDFQKMQKIQTEALCLKF